MRFIGLDGLSIHSASIKTLLQDLLHNPWSIDPHIPAYHSNNTNNIKDIRYTSSYNLIFILSF